MAFDKAAYQKEWTEKNREKVREYQREWQLGYYHRLRADALEKLGGKCVVCGTTERLEIHHVHGGGDVDRRLRSRNGVLRAVRNGEPGFELLCKPHHRAVS